MTSFIIWSIAAFLILLGVSHISSGMIKLGVFKDHIEEAFARDPYPFKPNQRWLLKLMLVLFWHKVDWWNEVFYYKDGKPEWQRTSPPPPPRVSNILPFCTTPNCRICNRSENTFDRLRRS